MCIRDSPYRLAYELRMALRPFVSSLYEVVSLDMDYFMQYGHEIDYWTNGQNFQNEQGDAIKVQTCFLGK